MMSNRKRCILTLNRLDAVPLLSTSTSKQQSRKSWNVFESDCVLIFGFPVVSIKYRALNGFSFLEKIDVKLVNT